MRELFKLSPYRSTQLPELVAFFEGHDEMLAKFLRRFMGTKFICPSPKMLGQIAEEREAIELLTRDHSVEGLLGVITQTEIPYARLAEIFQAVTGRVLHGPGFMDSSTPRLLVDAAIKAAQTFPKVPRTQIAEIYGLVGEQLEDFRVAMGLKKKTKPRKRKHK